MTENEIILQFIKLLNEKQEILTMANEIYFHQGKYVNFKYSINFRELLLDIITQENGKEFIIPRDIFLQKLWKNIDLSLCNFNHLHFVYNDLNERDLIELLEEELKIRSINLCDVVKDCRIKYKLNEFDALCFIKEFLVKININNIDMILEKIFVYNESYIIFKL
ncbi:MAG: hypothetical protein ACI4N3_01520 [Alphaproteobacteria bacterium]